MKFIFTLLFFWVSTAVFGQALEIAPNGNVGIGTTNPTAPLDIQSNIINSWTAMIQNNGVGAGHGLYLNLGLSNTGVPLRVSKNNISYLEVISNGNVGVGTSTPVEKLEVAGNIKSSGDLVVAGSILTGLKIMTTASAPGFEIIPGTTGSPTYIRIDNQVNVGGKNWRMGHTGAIAGFGTFDIHNETDNTTPISLKSNGDVSVPTGKLGIATSAPAEKLQIGEYDTNGNNIWLSRNTAQNLPVGEARSHLNFGAHGTVDYYVAYGDTHRWRVASAVSAWVNPTYGYNTKMNDDLVFQMKRRGYDEETPLVIQGGSGYVGIGTSTPTSKLDVAGVVSATSFKASGVTLNVPDYVFDKEYSLKSLEEVESAIFEKGHLPGLPSAEEIKAKGLDMVQMQLKLLEKVEELTLYSIAQNKALKEKELQMAALLNRIEKLEKQTK